MEAFTLAICALVLAGVISLLVMAFVIWQRTTELRTILLDAEERGVAVTKAVGRVMDAQGLLMDGVGLIVDHLAVQHEGADCPCKMGQTPPTENESTLAADETVNP